MSAIGTPQLAGVIIRKDGTVPFDDDCPDDTRSKTIAFLFDNGYQIEAVPGTKNLKIVDYNPTPQL